MQIVEDMLFAKQDLKYREFHCSLVPNILADTIIGVRTPVLRSLAKEISLADYCSEFLAELPHKYFDENQLHFFIIAKLKKFEDCINTVEEFLPYVDNWAVCDSSSPAVFKKHKKELLPYVMNWLDSEKIYTKRFGIRMLMNLFLEEDFDASYLSRVADLCVPHIQNADENYYLNMMVAWYFATALAFQWDAAFPVIKNKVLGKWVHNKAIQKAVESFRVSDEHKAILKGLRLN